MSEVPTNRVELENERWVEVRRLNVGDIRAAKLDSHERGFEDADLDAIALLPRVIINTSDGATTQEFVDSLTESDYGAVWMRVKGIDSPNALEPSSTSTRRAKASGKNNPTNG